MFTEGYELRFGTMNELIVCVCTVMQYIPRRYILLFVQVGVDLNISKEKLEFPGSIENGLAAEQVQTQLAKYGFNEIPEKRSSFLVTFGKHFWGLVPWMLEITAILTFFLRKYPDTIIIVALLLFNAALSLFQERRSRSATSALKQRLRIQSRVKRDGKWSVIQARELVPGDLVRVRIGDFVPAYIKIVDCTQFPNVLPV